jgi:ribonuclease T2
VPTTPRVAAAVTVIGAVVAMSADAGAQIPRAGSFVARRACPAYRSFRDAANPGNVTTTVDRAYALRGQNAAVATHYLVDVPEASPRQRWVAVDCGVVRTAGDVSPPSARTPAAGPPAPSRTAGRAARVRDAVLAVSWQPSFCEIRSSRPECTSMTTGRFDATHLTLHGLWPEGAEYCGVTPAQEDLDRAQRWDRLARVALAPSTREALARVMPGAQSHLDRHEWTRHGSCHGTSADDYFRTAIALLDALNASPVQAFLASKIGTSVDTNAIRAELDRAFGADAGSRVAFVCERERGGDRTLLTEMRIHVRGAIDATSDLRALILAAPKVPRGCGRGVVDAAGLQ